MHNNDHYRKEAKMEVMSERVLDMCLLSEEKGLIIAQDHSDLSYIKECESSVNGIHCHHILSFYHRFPFALVICILGVLFGIGCKKNQGVPTTNARDYIDLRAVVLSSHCIRIEVVSKPADIFILDCDANNTKERLSEGRWMVLVFHIHSSQYMIAARQSVAIGRALERICRFAILPTNDGFSNLNEWIPSGDEIETGPSPLWIALDDGEIVGSGWGLLSPEKVLAIASSAFEPQ